MHADISTSEPLCSRQGPAFTVSNTNFLETEIPDELLATIRVVRYSDAGREIHEADLQAIDVCYRTWLRCDSGFLKHLYELAYYCKTHSRKDPMLCGEVLASIEGASPTDQQKSIFRDKLLVQLEQSTAGSAATCTRKRYYLDIAEACAMYFNRQLMQQNSEIRKTLGIRERTRNFFQSISEVAKEEGCEQVITAAFLAIAKQHFRLLSLTASKILKNLREDFEDQLEVEEGAWPLIQETAKESARKLYMQGESLVGLLERAALYTQGSNSEIDDKQFSRIIVKSVDKFLFTPEEKLRTALAWTNHLANYNFVAASSSHPIISSEAVTADEFQALLKAQKQIKETLGQLIESQVNVSWSSPPRIAETLLVTDPERLVVYSPFPWSLNQDRSISDLRRDLYRLVRNKFEGNPIPLLGIVKDGRELQEWELESLGVSPASLEITVLDNNQALIRFKLNNSDKEVQRSILYKYEESEVHDGLRAMFSDLNFEEQPAMVSGAPGRPPIAVLIYGQKLNRQIERYNNTTISERIALYISNNPEAIEAAKQRQKDLDPNSNIERPAIRQKTIIDETAISEELKTKAKDLAAQWAKVPEDSAIFNKYKLFFNQIANGVFLNQ